MKKPLRQSELRGTTRNQDFPTWRFDANESRARRATIRALRVFIGEMAHATFEAIQRLIRRPRKLQCPERHCRAAMRFRPADPERFLEKAAKLTRYYKFARETGARNGDVGIVVLVVNKR